MFPFDIEDDEVEVTEEEQSELTEWEIDFSTGQLTGAKVYGKDALKVWAWLCLGTPRYYFEQNSWEYGNELYSLIGHSYSEEYLKSEGKRIIEEALTVNENITGVKDLEITVNGDELIASFTMETSYGEVEMNV